MFLSADIVVQAVMVGLALASLLCWTIFLAKSVEIGRAIRRLHRDLRQLEHMGRRAIRPAHLTDATIRSMLAAANEEQAQGWSDRRAALDRLSIRLERIVAMTSRRLGKGTGILATIGATSPFVGLFGTVWGIMNSFVGISRAQTTNLAVVAPGIAEALLATAMGLVAAIPAVVIYNLFARAIAAYKASAADAVALVLVGASRSLESGGVDAPATD